MATGVLVKTVVFDRHIYRRFGMAQRWLAVMTDEFAAFAVEFAPMRSGELREGISGDTRQVGERQIEGTIESAANHSLFVLGGTTGPIRTTKGFLRGIGPGKSYQMLWKDTAKGRRKVRVPIRGYWMPIPAFGPFPAFYADEVSGQSPQNFLFDAWRATARNHSSIRGKLPDHLF